DRPDVHRPRHRDRLGAAGLPGLPAGDEPARDADLLPLRGAVPALPRAAGAGARRQPRSARLRRRRPAQRADRALPFRRGDRPGGAGGPVRHPPRRRRLSLLQDRALSRPGTGTGVRSWVYPRSGVLGSQGHRNDEALRRISPMRIPARAAMAASPLPLLLVLLLPAPAAQAQGLDVTGSWSIQMSTVARATNTAAVTTGCTFQGTANVVQTGSQFAGDATVDLTSGGMTCPPTMSASLSGNVTGNTVSMGMAMGGGAFGTGTFTGTVLTAPARGAGTNMGGSFAVTGGPFSGTGGTLSATQLASIPAVPALGAKGLAALALLLLATALWFLLRRSAQQRL